MAAVIGDAERLLAHLGRGGAFQYFWRASDKTSRWFAVGQPPQLRIDRDVYFGVHPVASTRGSHQRSTNESICAINCLFAEFDAKDFGGDLDFTLWYVEHLRIPPSVCICSGGGYHGYWLLSEPVSVTDDNREAMQRLQARWVGLVGGDDGAKDLARVLRLPGTLNTKYDPPRPVAFTWYDDDHFPIECLQMHLDTFGPPEKTYAAPVVSVPAERAKARTQEGYRARAYGLAAMQAELDDLARTSSGNRNKRLNQAAYKLGALTAGGLLEPDEAVRALANTALSMGTDASFTATAIKATIKSGFSNGLRQPRGVPDAH